MKRKVITLAIAAASTAYVGSAFAEAPTFYGKANLSLQKIDEEHLGLTTQDNWELLSNASRLGIKGSANINDKLKAIYKFEYEVFLDGESSGSGGSNFKQRNSYVGLQGDFGAVIAGKHDTPTKLAQGKVDRFNDLKFGDIKNVMAGEQRENNIIIYSSPKIADSLILSLAIMPGEENATSGNDDDGIADHISASATYTMENISLAVATDQDVDNTDLFRLVGEYKGDNFKIGAIFQTAEESNNGGMIGLSGITKDYSALYDIVEQDAYLVSGEYALDKDIVLKAQYGYSESTHEIGLTKADTDLTQIIFGADYKLNKKSKVFAYISMIEADNNALVNDSENSTFGVGYELKF